MQGTIAFVALVGLLPLLITLAHLFSKNTLLWRFMVVLNLLVWGYELFFLAAVCEMIPRASVHFGGGLGDLFFFFLLVGIILLHIIALSIITHRTKKIIPLIIPLGIVLLPLISMHSIAARGNRGNDYMTSGNFVGLYYDSEAAYRQRERARAREEAAKPKKPEFTSQFESDLYDAERGDIWAQNHIGICYMKGNGVEKNDTLGVKWFLRAAENGELCAQHSIGLCYYYGLGGLKVNYPEAVKWFRKAAEEGFDNAQYELGRCYGKGTGVEQNDTEAYRWLHLAAEQGHKKAKELLEANGQSIK